MLLLKSIKPIGLRSPKISQQCQFRYLSTSINLLKESYKREKTNINIGTIGHVDHGKTTLTAAITKVLSDRNPEFATFKAYDQIDNAPEEQKRGITINSMTIEYETDLRHYTHTDCPGHKDFIKNMICGASALDGAILVVAATDGTMPQTREHLQLIKALGVKDLLVFINKVDAVDEEMIELVEMELREVLSDFGFDGDNMDLVHGSALCTLDGTQDKIGKKAVEKLIDQIDNQISEPVRDKNSDFLLHIERPYVIPSRGIVVVGNVERGVIKKNEKVDIIGYGKNFPGIQVQSIETFLKSMDDGAQAGDQIGILVKGLKKSDVRRGMALVKAKTLKPMALFRGQVYVLTKDDGAAENIPLTNRSRFHVYCNTFNCIAKIVGKKQMIMPGDTAEVEIMMREDMPITKDSAFTLRMMQQTVATGKILGMSDRKLTEVETLHQMVMNGDNKAKKKLVTLSSDGTDII